MTVPFQVPSFLVPPVIDRSPLYDDPEASSLMVAVTVCTPEASSDASTRTGTVVSPALVLAVPVSATHSSMVGGVKSGWTTTVSSGQVVVLLLLRSQAWQ